ncbi:MAG: efflux RND transporter periplasmic adaptor subunit [Firmicutes bacterium]|jgi:RND family efflux transporter MFP subunit|nr:efflux RND transporter periplasmic adaptor subunit [Bacillota bacterium]
MNKRLAVILVGILLVTLVFQGCVRTEKVGSSTSLVEKPVRVIKVSDENYQNVASYSGNIKPSQMVKLSTKISGVIDEYMVVEGQKVKKGDIILKLDDYEYGLGYDAAKAKANSIKLEIDSKIPSAINQAKAKLDLVEKRYNDMKKLYEEGAVTKDNLDEAETAYISVKNVYQEALDARSIANENYKQALANKDLKETNYEDTVLRSPIDGVILKTLFESGESIAPTYPAVVIGDVNSIEAELGVPDSVINSLYVGQKVKAYVYGIEKSVSGEIIEVSALADTKTRTFPVKVRISNENSEMKAGMMAKIDIVLDEKEGILVPLDSVLNLSEGSTVFVLNSDDGTVKKKIVETGEIVDDRIEVISGLENNEELVIEGQYKLKDNDLVKVAGDE